MWISAAGFLATIVFPVRLLRLKMMKKLKEMTKGDLISCKE